MNNPLVRFVILLSILFLMIFPFAGLAPLTVLLFVAILGWAVQLATIILGATKAPDAE